MPSWGLLSWPGCSAGSWEGFSGCRVHGEASGACLAPKARPPAAACLSQDLPDYLAVHVGQAEVAAGVAVGELLVVEAHQVQDRRVQVVDVDRVLLRLEAELVGRAVGRA